MGAKTRELINMMMNIQDRMSLMYKNVSAIDGQYDVQLRTTAKVLSALLKKRAEYFRDILDAAADGSDDASEEGYSAIKDAVTVLAGKLKQQNFSSVYGFIDYAIIHMESIIAIVDLSIERIKMSGLSQESLHVTLLQIRSIEEESTILLKGFLKNSEHLV